MSSDLRRLRPRQRALGLIVAASMGVAASWGIASIAGGSASFTDLRGTYTGGACAGLTLAECEASPQSTHTATVTSEDFNTGAISGTGFVGQSTGPITGQITGCTVAIHVDDGSGYKADVTETISADGNTLEGTFSDSDGEVNQPVFDKRTSGGPSTCPPGDSTTTSTPTSTSTSSSTSTTTTTTTTPGKHATATQVICNYEFATSSNTCGASVGDADASGATPTQPTGTVTFTGPADGSFASGATCTLGHQPTAPSVGFCSIIFTAPDGSLPTITATYGGDAQHAGSSGHTKFFAADPSGDTTDTPGQAANGQYPNEVDLSTTVPADGTEVDACATSTATAAAASVVPRVRVLARPHDTAGAVAQTIASDITHAHALQTTLNTIKGQSAAQRSQSLNTAFDQSTNSQMDRSLADLAAGQAALASGQLGPTEAAQLQAEINQQQQLLDQISSLLKTLEAQTCKVISNMNSLRALAASRRASKRKTVVVLGRIRRGHAAAGRLTLHLRLNHSALRRAGGTRKSLSVVLRITMIVPSRVLKPGRVIVIGKTLKLHTGHRRAKART